MDITWADGLKANRLLMSGRAGPRPVAGMHDPMVTAPQECRHRTLRRPIIIPVVGIETNRLHMSGRGDTRPDAEIHAPMITAPQEGRHRILRIPIIITAVGVETNRLHMSGSGSPRPGAAVPIVGTGVCQVTRDPPGTTLGIQVRGATRDAPLGIAGCITLKAQSNRRAVGRRRNYKVRRRMPGDAAP